MLKKLLIGRKLLQPIFERLHRISLRGMNYGMAAFVESSGELFLIQKLRNLVGKPTEELVLFDVGANDGYYLDCLLNYFTNDDSIHSFEPSPYTFQKLNEKFGKEKGVHLNNFGLSSEATKKKLFFDSPGSGWSSLHPIEHSHLNVKLDNEELVELKTLDHYCSTNSIDHIDFLKMDVEGHELAVLEGSREMIKKGAISCIQFEFGIAHLISKVFLKDFFEILDGYSIYRILQNGLHKINYSERYEIFMNSNYVAIRD